MKTTSAKAAKAIKAELKAKFPTVNFSVVSDNFSGGDAVRIDFFDGPKTEDVLAIVKKYQYGEFNSQEDIYEHTNSIEGMDQVKYITVKRRMSDKAQAQIADEYEKGSERIEKLKESSVEFFTDDSDINIRRIFNTTSY